METGWTYTEIKNMPFELKLLYMEFIKTEQKKTQELIEERMDRARGGSGKDSKEFKFINEKDFYSQDGEKFINQEQVDFPDDFVSHVIKKKEGEQ